jgi:tetratricopeptide (TPR) repeat protein
LELEQVLIAEPKPAPPGGLSDVVYNTLAGDLAIQRGAYLVAHRHYLDAARASSNAGLAELATKAGLAGQDQAASLAGVKLWLTLGPDSEAALQIAALLAAQDNDLDAAVGYLRRVVELNEAAGENGFLEVARLLTKVRNSDLRLNLMRRLTVGREQDPDALFALALVEAGSRNLPQAEAAARRVLELRPDWDEARALLVRMLASQGKTAEARLELERFLKDSPEDHKLRAVYARLLVEEEELEAALEQFRRLLDADPNDADALLALGILSLHLEQREQAKEYMRRLYRTEGRKDEAAFHLGQIYEDEGNQREALRWFQDAGGERLLEAQIRIARIHAERGETSRAREVIQQLRARHGQDAVQLDLIEGEILRDAKHYEEAMEVFTQALERHPDNHDLLYSRALTAVYVQRIDVLERDLRLIIAQDPQHVDALNALGYTLADQTDRYQEAYEYIQRALALKPDSAAVLDSMGWVLYRLGRHQEALRYLWRAIALLPDSEIAAHLGEVLWESGERQRAQRVWDEALEREPDSEHLRRVLERYGVTR